MAYWTWAKDQVGSFVEKSAGNVFEYSLNDEDFNQPDFPHKIWVGDHIGNPFRYAKVMKTRAYIVTDEDDYGKPVVEKWYIKNHREYLVPTKAEDGAVKKILA